MRLLEALGACALAAALAPGTVAGQGLPELLAAIQDGGGWVSFDIRGGVGSFESVRMPTGGLRLVGHVRIWEESSGTWNVTARDLMRPGDQTVLEFEAGPGERVDFSYQAGLVAQLRVDIRWSEPRDTTLWAWVGLGEGEGDSPMEARLHDGAGGSADRGETGGRSGSLTISGCSRS